LHELPTSRNSELFKWTTTSVWVLITLGLLAKARAQWRVYAMHLAWALRGWPERSGLRAL